MTTDTIILIEYESGKSEWRPSTVETLSHIVGNLDCIAGLRELEAGATAPADNGADNDDWEGIADQAIRERDEALGRVDWWAIHGLKLRAQRDEAVKELQQVKAQKLQAVRVLVGADECCGECQDASESENQRRAGGDDE